MSFRLYRNSTAAGSGVPDGETKRQQAVNSATQKYFTWMIGLFALLHIAALLLLHKNVVALNLIIGVSPLIPAVCIWWRTRRLERWQRSAWYWMIVGLLLWCAAQMLELHNARAANNVTPTFSDYLFFLVAIPLLLAASTTPATRTIPGVSVMNALQSLLAAGLLYVRLFRMPVTATTGGVSILYDLEFLILILTVTLRYLAATLPEDKRSLGLLWAYLMIYLPAEATVDYVSRRWSLQIGTPADLCFTLPFLFLAWYALKMPTRDTAYATDLQAKRPWKLFLQSLCPMLFSCGVFALGASVASAHLLLAGTVMMLCLILQGLHAGAIQTRSVLDHIRLQFQEQQLVEANALLERLSFQDELTGISNRRHLMEALERECRRADRREEWLSVLMIDVDHFKGVNDLHGHAYGDDCLATLAGLLVTLNRGMDLAARFGGEEFIVMLPNTEASGASVVAERLHFALRNRALANKAAPGGLVTISVGIATLQVHRGVHAGSLIEAADGALYRAKRMGRNQTQIMQVEAVSPDDT